MKKVLPSETMLLGEMSLELIVVSKDEMGTKKMSSKMDV